MRVGSDVSIYTNPKIGIVENEIEVAGQTSSTRLRVRSNVFICAMEIAWHDRRGQHGGMLDQMCQYALI